MTNRTGFLLAEDQALKVKFSSIQLVDDRDATRDVQVFFRYPEAETEKKYPFITLGPCTWISPSCPVLRVAPS